MKNQIHFIGIGGIGVSALARYYKALGWEVSGSDLAQSEITEALKKLEISVVLEGASFQSFGRTHLPTLVVYSPAVKPDNPELKYFKDMGVKCLSYPQALGELTKNHFTIAVSGTHGKSTTTAMLGLVLEAAGLDPTVIVGTKLKEFGDSNFRAGKSQYLVIEACEYESSFLNYFSKIIALTNIEEEHMDYFKNLSHILKVFREYIGNLPNDGTLVYNSKDKNIKKIIKGLPASAKSYGAAKEAKKIKQILKVPGKHNISNALAVLTVARELKIPDKTTYQALSKFTGTWRRFDIRKGRIDKKFITVISDYGHHPTEIKATFDAIKEKFGKRSPPPLQLRRAKHDIWCVFQPHQHQRTHYLFKDFVKVFNNPPVDKLIITDIYDVAGREEKQITKKTSDQKLVKKINKKKVLYVPFDDLESYISTNIKSGDILLIMGAGNIYNLSLKFISFT